MKAKITFIFYVAIFMVTLPLSAAKYYFVFGGLYTSPRIEIICLDNEISLALESTPAGPYEGYLKIPDYMKIDT